MSTSFNDLYNEIVAMKNDLEEHLKNNDLSPQVKQLAEEELADLNMTLEKIRNGYYGVCEETGQPIPVELLFFQPTARTFREFNKILKFFKKPVFPI